MHTNLKLVVTVAAVATVEHMNARRISKKNKNLAQENNYLRVINSLYETQIEYMGHMIDRHDILTEFDAIVLSNPDLNQVK
jgi:hypothetical protein